MLCFILVNYRAKAQRGINYQATGVHFAELGWAQAAPDDEKDQATHTPRPHPSAAHPGDTSAPHRAKPSAALLLETFLLDMPEMLFQASIPPL